MSFNQYLTEIVILQTMAQINYLIVNCIIWANKEEQEQQEEDDKKNSNFVQKIGTIQFILAMIMAPQIFLTFSIQTYRLLKFVKYLFQYPLQRSRFVINVLIEIIYFSTFLVIFLYSRSSVKGGLIKGQDLANNFNYVYVFSFVIFSILCIFQKYRIILNTLIRIVPTMFVECKLQLKILAGFYLYIVLKGIIEIILYYSNVTFYETYFNQYMEFRVFLTYFFMTYNPSQIDTAIIKNSQIKVAKWKENEIKSSKINLIQAARQKYYIMSRKLVTENRSLNHLDNWKKLDKNYNFQVQNIKFCNFPEDKSSGEVLVNSFMAKNPKFITVQLIEKFSAFNVSQQCLVYFLNVNMKIIKAHQFNNFGAKHFNFFINQKTLQLVRQDIRNLTIFDLKKSGRYIKLKIEQFNSITGGYKSPDEQQEINNKINQLFINNQYFDENLPLIRRNNNDQQQQQQQQQDENIQDRRQHTFKPVQFFSDNQNSYIIFGYVQERQDGVAKQIVRNLFCCSISHKEMEEQQQKNKNLYEQNKDKNLNDYFFQQKLILKVQCDIIWDGYMNRNQNFRVQQFSDHEIILYEQVSKKMYIYDCLNKKLSPIIIVGLRYEYITDLHFYNISQYLSELGFVSCSVVFNGRVHAYSLIYKGEIIYISNASQCDMGHSQDFRYILIEHVNALRRRLRRNRRQTGLIYKTVLIDIKKLQEQQVVQQKHNQLIANQNNKNESQQKYQLSQLTKQTDKQTVYLQIND